MDYNLDRFIDAQAEVYSRALSEIKSGRKTSHWMWFIFPQIKGLGQSDIAKHYSIKNLDEATAYLNHPVLGRRLVEISTALLEIDGKSSNQIFGSPDDLKLRSSMTLFSNVTHTNPVFDEVLSVYFNGQPDKLTLQILQL
jgi:uncharacterized protein (DUF1810 family)